MAGAPRPLVLGLGNPILGDDAIGWHIARALATEVDPDAVEVDYQALGGLALMERLAGYRHALLLDAVVSGAPAGTVFSLPAARLGERLSGHTACAHDLGLAAALDLGRTLGLALPQRPWLVGVEARPQFEFGERLSDEVARALPRALDAARAWLRG
jgi:hydrogenase maturation protease